MYDLNRFLSAQRRDYAAALREIRSGRKRSHWIWISSRRSRVWA